MNGTRVRLFPQSEGFAEPVIVTLSLPAGTVGPGPADPDLRTVLPVDKRRPYAPPAYLPPYEGATLPPAEPDASGGFDWIPLSAPQFLSQHLYGGIRFTLDHWERYFGRPIRWWHADRFPRLELIPRLDWNNAHSGPGFIETGFRTTTTGEVRLFALNQDVIAHETGHAILFSEVGIPVGAGLTAGYLAFHESFCDLIALITALHFPPVVDRLLANTRGNLYVTNLVARIGELSAVEQIRVADNTTTVGEIAAMRLAENGDWIDPSGLDRTAHDASLPLTGAIFDVLVDLFQDNLVSAGVLPPPLDARGWDEDTVQRSFARLEAASGDLLASHEAVFRAALAEARDTVGLVMARTMRTVDGSGLTFDAVALRMVEAAAMLGLPRVQTAFVENFQLRGIDPWRRWAFEQERAHVRRRVSYAERRGLVLDRALRRPPPALDAAAAIRGMISHDERSTK